MFILDLVFIVLFFNPNPISLDEIVQKFNIDCLAILP